MKLFSHRRQGDTARKRKLVLMLYAADGTCVRVAPAEFALPEAVTLSLSTLYFDDPEPCQIHRAAVLSRAMMELSEHIGTGRRVEIALLDDALRAYFGEYPDATAFEFLEE